MKLELNITGDGAPIIFVHGSASDYRTWDQQRDFFSSAFRVVTYSRRYHWPNAPIADGAEYSMRDHVDDLKQVIESVSNDGATLVGSSYGAYLALMLSIEAPSLVNRMVLAEPPVIPLFTSFPPKPHEIIALLLTRPATGLSIVKFVATGLAPAKAAAKRGDMDAALSIFARAVLGKKMFEKMPEERRKQARANFTRAELVGDNVMMKINPRDVRGIDVPTLLVTGEQSPRMFHFLTDRLEELLPNVLRRDVPRASHAMHEDNPAGYNAVVMDFLRLNR